VLTERSGRGAATNRFRRIETAGPAPVAVPVEVAAAPDPQAVEFVRFCYLRRRVSWPELYDEMCLVAARGAFRGMCYDELAEIGVKFTLSALPPLVQLAQRVVAEERAVARRSLADGRPEAALPHPQLAPIPG
jgi:hypothetical protein